MFVQRALAMLGVGPASAAWFALQILLIVLGALLAGRSDARRYATLPFLLAVLLLPLVAPLPALPRTLLACLGLLGALKILQLDFEPRWQAQHPVWHALSPFDVSGARRVPRRLDAGALLLVLLHAFVLALVVAALLHLPPSVPGPVRGVLRLLLGAALVYCAMEVATEGLRLGHQLAGVEVPPIQRTPLFSRSVGEFWSQRWNRPVSGWLDEYVFRPLVRRRRGSATALMAAFGVSAALHAWMYFAALGLRAAASVSLFFCLQAPVVMLEAKLGVSRWPSPVARAWTLAWLLGTSPLFVEPLLRGLAL